MRVEEGERERKRHGEKGERAHVSKEMCEQSEGVNNLSIYLSIHSSIYQESHPSI
jgi:hypothetical protein